MTATALPLTTLKHDKITDIPAGSVIDQSNGMTIAITTSDIPVDPDMDHLFLYIQTTNGADKTVTVKAGVGGGATPGAAFRSGIGDLTVTAHAATGGGIIGPLDPSRFAQSDGSVLLAFQSGITGWITAFIMQPRFYAGS